MALSMDEQRMLAEIERRLSAEDPRLAARLSSFKGPGPALTLRTPRGKLIGSLCALALVAVVSTMVYAMVPFRAHGPKTTSSPQASTSAPRFAASAGASANASAASGNTARTGASGRTASTASTTSTTRTAASGTTKGNTSAKATGNRAAPARTAGTKTVSLAPATTG
jgi:cytoskeletal protein RodZ